MSSSFPSSSSSWLKRLPAHASAPAKVNLGLFVGPVRADGRHELATVMQSISLADELTLQAAGEGAREDEVSCPGLAAPARENLAWRALCEFRARSGWRAPALRLTIAKSIPVAAGLGGGSADAAAALRLARHVSGLGDEDMLRELAAGLGADVPAQVRPGRWLATGAGERLSELACERALALLVLPVEAELSTAAVYGEADRLGLARSAQNLEERRRALAHAWSAHTREPGRAFLTDSETLDNDLQPAALSLCPQIADALQQAREAGADRVLVSGSGPTVIGLFGDDQDDEGRPRGARNALARSREAAALLTARRPAPICAVAVGGADWAGDIGVRHNQRARAR